MSESDKKHDTPSNQALKNNPVDASLKIPNITLLRQIGKGGFGSVYVGEHQILQKEVAVKLLNTESADSRWAERFKREGQALSRLSHPNIVRILSFSILDSGKTVMVMELIKGRTLQQIVDNDGPLPLERWSEYAKQLCDALQYAHEMGIVHRDIKPGNIMITEEGVVKLLDFGVAKLIDEESFPASQRLTSTGQFMGTPAYMSPEQCTGKPADKASDVYALCCVFLYMLTGRTLFSGNNEAEIMLKHCKETPKLSKLEIPDDLLSLIGKGVKKDPKSRYADCKALYADLMKADLYKTSSRKAHFPIKALAITGGIIASVTAGYLLLNRPHSTSDVPTGCDLSVELASLTEKAYNELAAGEDAKAQKTVNTALSLPLPQELSYRRWPAYRILHQAMRKKESLSISTKMYEIIHSSSFANSKLPRKTKALWELETLLIIGADEPDEKKSKQFLDQAESKMPKIVPSLSHDQKELWSNFFNARMTRALARKDLPIQVRLGRQITSTILTTHDYKERDLDYVGEALLASEKLSQKETKYKKDSEHFKEFLSKPLLTNPSELNFEQSMAALESLRRAYIGIEKPDEILVLYRRAKPFLISNFPSEELTNTEMRLLLSCSQCVTVDCHFTTEEKEQLLRDYARYLKIPNKDTQQYQTLMRLAGATTKLIADSKGLDQAEKHLTNYLSILPDHYKMMSSCWFLTYWNDRKIHFTKSTTAHLTKVFIEAIKTRVKSWAQQPNPEEEKIIPEYVLSLGITLAGKHMEAIPVLMEANEVLAPTNISAEDKVRLVQLTAQYMIFAPSRSPLSAQQITILKNELLSGISEFKTMNSAQMGVTMLAIQAVWNRQKQLGMDEECWHFIDKVTQVLDQRKYFAFDDLKEVCLAYWFEAANSWLQVKKAEQVDISLCRKYKDEMLDLATSMLYGPQQLNIALTATNACSVLARNNATDEALAFAKELYFLGNQDRSRCNVSTRAYLLNIGPTLIAQNKIKNRPNTDELNRWREELFALIAEAGENPSPANDISSLGPACCQIATFIAEKEGKKAGLNYCQKVLTALEKQNLALNAHNMDMIKQTMKSFQS